eukprot:TRINITY_DN16491_c0_g1_i1.p1 TRINITY_DN16491_c0_g1~~TRINITY_DN16491_c0_g1_i1.p1  ORF type:complete len:297 (-),score=23.95 TRINITY_DN16491_c0_g1_i1:163-1053(-)
MKPFMAFTFLCPWHYDHSLICSPECIFIQTLMLALCCLAVFGLLYLIGWLLLFKRILHCISSNPEKGYYIFEVGGLSVLIFSEVLEAAAGQRYKEQMYVWPSVFECVGLFAFIVAVQMQIYDKPLSQYLNACYTALFFLFVGFIAHTFIFIVDPEVVLAWIFESVGEFAGLALLLLACILEKQQHSKWHSYADFTDAAGIILLTISSSVSWNFLYCDDDAHKVLWRCAVWADFCGMLVLYLAVICDLMAHKLDHCNAQADPHNYVAATDEQTDVEMSSLKDNEWKDDDNDDDDANL